MGGWVTARVSSFFNEGEKQPVEGERIRKDFILWGVDQRIVRGKRLWICQREGKTCLSSFVPHLIDSEMEEIKEGGRVGRNSSVARVLPFIAPM